jgi:gamma-glutamyltranspeptidase
VFLPGDKAPLEGDTFRNPDLGRAYRILAEEGPRSFYEGRIAGAMLSAIRDYGGLMTAEDLNSFTSEWVEPICVWMRRAKSRHSTARNRCCLFGPGRWSAAHTTTNGMGRLLTF